MIEIVWDQGFKRSYRKDVNMETDTFLTFLSAAQFVETIEKRQGYKIACLEEIAWRNGWLSSTDLEKAGQDLKKNSYGKYLLDLVHDAELSALLSTHCQVG